MKLTIKNKFFALLLSSTVFAENGMKIYESKGKFSLTAKNEFVDLHGNTVFIIRAKAIAWTPTVIIYDKDENEIARFIAKISMFTPKYTIKGTNRRLDVKGNIIAWNFQILADGVKIGNIRRKFNLVDEYELDVDNPGDGPFLAACVIALNMIEVMIRQAKARR